MTFTEKYAVDVTTKGVRHAIPVGEFTDAMVSHDGDIGEAVIEVRVGATPDSPPVSFGAQLQTFRPGLDLPGAPVSLSSGIKVASFPCAPIGTLFLEVITEDETKARVLVHVFACNPYRGE